jgi:DNA-binding CsgD family transcriptional regulator
MLQPFRPETIYDAATDDEAFEQLASTLAAAIGARSGVFHWKDFREATEEVSYSGYFSIESMVRYEQHFADADLWSAAVKRPERINQVWNLDALVPVGEYKSGRLYNEWIRPMGDDSFHAMGGAFRTDTAIGEIGFHRGKGQGAFDEEAVRIVKDGFSHLRRMLEIRSKLGGSRRLAQSASAALDFIGHGIITLQSTGQVLHCNLAAEAVLRRADGLTLHNGRLQARHPGDQAALHAALDRAAAPSSCHASAALIRRAEGRPYEVSIISAWVEGRRQLILVLADPDARNLGLLARLRDLYGLTPAEGEVAICVADGMTPPQIAAKRRVSIATVHSQFKTIFSKLGCGRQSEVAAMVSNLPRLYDPA